MRGDYSYQTRRGAAGTLYDISPYAIDSRLCDGPDGAMKYGMGTVAGEHPGATVALPTEASGPADFAGIAMTGHATEMDMDGSVGIRSQQTVGALAWGRAWARTAPGTEPKYGEAARLITSGPDAGLFTNDERGIPVRARFIGEKGSGDVAPVELFNQRQE